MASPFRREFDGAPAQPAAYATLRPLTAAASRIKLDDKTEAEQFRKRRNSTSALWQTAAWEYYDAIPEIKYALNLVSNIVSRIRLYVATVEDPAEAPVPIRNATNFDADKADMAERALARLDSAYGGQAGMLRDASLNLAVAGECYLVQIPPRYGVSESWDIRSVDELKSVKVGQDDQYYIAPRREIANVTSSGSSKLPDGAIPLLPGAFVGRLWRAHPRFSEEPDSSLRGLLDLCDELLLLSRSFRATERSRLNAGALYVPDGLSTAANPEPDLYADEEDPGPTAEEIADEFEENLIEAMTTPIEDESSASAVVPLIIRGPADLGEKIKQFKFERSNDATMLTRADRVLDRILQGLDVPKDTVTGMSNVKYSNAIQIDEALYKAHIEPMLLMIADALTVVFLRPYLKQVLHWDEADADRVVVWYDPSSVATRNDRAADADSGYDKLAISADTWRRAHGFSDADAPTPNEMILRLLQEKGTLTPELSQALLTVIAPEIMEATRAAQQATSVAPVPADVAQALGGAPGAPADPNAPVDPTADPNSAAPVDPTTGQPSTADPNATSAGVTPGAPVDPGQDAPPFEVDSAPAS